MALNLIMLGAPGAGKGTQAERFMRRWAIPKISTGEILRDAVNAGTGIGLRVKAVMARGELVGDDVMIEIVRERLERPDALGGFILDGFPRTVAQATALDAIMDGRDPLIIIDIAVDEAELMRRLGSRTICEDCGANAGDAAEEVKLGPESAAAVAARTEPLRCRRCGGRLVQRTDDNAKVVRERLKVYHRQTEPLVEYYRLRPTFRSIDGAQPPDRVAADLAAAIESVGRGLRVGNAAPGGARR
jgi:adenylate kinase